MKLVVHVDGGSRGNPGPAAAAAVLSTPDGDVVDEAAVTLGRRPTTSRSTAGCCSGSSARPRSAPTEVEVINDSELIAHQVNGRYKVKHPDMKPLHAEALRGAGRLRALVDPAGAAGAERRGGRPGKPGAGWRARLSRSRQAAPSTPPTC